ncbi:MAG: prepilin-type N-terminal cleavage/methylation domain-containing protein, partial [Planctomycetota bacterium]
MSRAFTLIELVVVLVLIGALIAFSPLALDSLVAERELEKEASRYGSLVELVVRETVLHRTPHAIHFDTEKNAYAFQVPEMIEELEDDEGNVRETLALDLDL